MRIALSASSTPVEQLTAVFSAEPRLSTLDLTDNQLGSMKHSDLCGMLACLKESSVKSLFLTGTGLSYKTTPELKELAAILSDTHITSLCLQNNFFGIHKSVPEIKEFIDGFGSSSVKRVIDMTCNHLDMLDPDELHDVLTSNPSLTVVFESPSAAARPK